MSAIAFLVVLMVLAAFLVTMAGGVSMSRGGRYDLLHAFPLMEARVILSAIALGMLIISTLFW